MRKLIEKTGSGPRDCGCATKRDRAGYVLYWQLTRSWGCTVTSMAPTLDTGQGGRPSEDRPSRDAVKLARAATARETSRRCGCRTPSHEALRDLVRARAGGQEGPAQGTGTGSASSCCGTGDALRRAIRRPGRRSHLEWVQGATCASRTAGAGGDPARGLPARRCSDARDQRIERLEQRHRRGGRAKCAETSCVLSLQALAGPARASRRSDGGHDRGGGGSS